MHLFETRHHAAADVALVVLMFLLPVAFGFEGFPADVARVGAWIQLGMVVISAYPLGLAKMLPFRAHGVVEGLSALAWLGIPFAFGFSSDDGARNGFHLVGGLMGLLVVVTRYREVGDWTEMPGAHAVRDVDFAGETALSRRGRTPV